MAPFERRFVRPSRFQVVDTLLQAAEAAGAAPVADDDRQRWDSFVSDIHDQPEGYHQWDAGELPGDNPGVVVIAWWTDRLHRRHFRIWAVSCGDDGQDCMRRHESDSRPPVWHLAPDQLFGRHRAGEYVWLAVCACGMTGTPQAIGWMGDRCGCCHYKPAEPPAEAPVHFATLRDARQPLKQLAFSPDGRWLAGAGGGKAVHLWDVAERRHQRIAHPNMGETLALTFTPDSRLLAIASSDRSLHFVQVPTGEEAAAYPTPQAVSCVTIAPDNLTLALVADRTLEVWGRPDGGLPWLPIYVREARVVGAAFNSRGNRLAIGFSTGVEVLGIIERAGCPHLCRSRWLSRTPRPLAFSRDGKRVILIQQENPQKVVSWEIDHNHDISSRPLHSASYAISPDVEWVAGIQDNGIDLEHVRDPQRWFLLRSGHYFFTAVAFSPDGHTLATADEDGAVKLWPWRRLVEA